jgi:hypothetical protein
MPIPNVCTRFKSRQTCVAQESVSPQTATRQLKMYMCIGDRAVCKHWTDGQGVYIPLRSPAAVATASLIASYPLSEPLLHSFLNAGGFSTLVNSLRTSRCPLEHQIAAVSIQRLLLERQDRWPEIADACWKAGGCGHRPTSGM